MREHQDIKDSATDGRPLLGLTNVTIDYGGIRALDSVSLTIGRGELVSIIGPNGAGKTTLFDVMSGRQAPSAGRVSFDGKDITKTAFHDVSRLGLVRTFQTVQLFGDQTVDWHVDMAQNARRYQQLARSPRSSSRSWPDRRRSAPEVLEQVGLARKHAVRPDELTLFERQMLSIAMCLVRSPSMILLDEPFAGLRTEEEDRMTEVIDVLRKRNDVTVALIEHKMRVVMSISDRVIVMSRGTLLTQGAPEAVRSDQRVIDTYLAGG